MLFRSGFQETLELQEWLVIKHDVVNLIETDTFLGEAIVHRMRRKAGVVLFAAEALLLRGGNNLAIADQSSSAVVVKSGNAEDSQRNCPRSLKERVDEGRDSATLCKYQKSAKKQHHHNDWQQPELLPSLHEVPQLSKERHPLLLRIASTWYRVGDQGDAGQSNRCLFPALVSNVAGLCLAAVR